MSFEDDNDDAGFERDTRAWCDRCGEQQDPDELAERHIDGDLLLLCPRCAEAADDEDRYHDNRY